MPAGLGIFFLTVGLIAAIVSISPTFGSTQAPTELSPEEAAVSLGADAPPDGALEQRSASVSSIDQALPLGVFPDPIAQAPLKVRDAYEFVADPDNHELVQSLTCYCGCDRGLAHQSLFNCYIEKLVPGGRAVYATHGIGCLTCLSEIWDAAKWQAEGKGGPEIKGLIDAAYGDSR